MDAKLSLDLLRQHSPWIACFSGGKDSTATLLWALTHNPDNTLAIFCDTGAEWPETYTYLDRVEERLDLAIIRLSTDATLEDLVRERGRWPACLRAQHRQALHTAGPGCHGRLPPRPRLDGGAGLRLPGSARHGA